MTVQFFQLILISCFSVLLFFSIVVVYLEWRKFRKRWYKVIFDAPFLLAFTSILLSFFVSEYAEKFSYFYTKGLSSLLLLLYGIYSTLFNFKTEESPGSIRLTLRGALGITFLVTTGICAFSAEAVSTFQQDENKRIADENAKGFLDKISNNVDSEGKKLIRRIPQFKGYKMRELKRIKK
ncbi:MAG: hypothetical protein HS129_03735 [Leptospiraceae bacterium]|nr:hypothetical protein [Leptospiraceae bacterium]